MAALPPFAPIVINSGIATTTAFTSVLNMLNSAFLTNTTAFVASAGCRKPDEWHGGVWGRAIGGQFDSTATGTVVGTAGAVAIASGARTGFWGAQFGVDAERCNIAGSGWNAHFGITGGYLGANSSANPGTGTVDFSIPFVGLYAAVTGGGFFADFQVRGDFYDIRVNDPNLGVFGQTLGGQALSAGGSAGYRHDIGPIFVEPSFSFVWSRLSVDSLRTSGIGAVPVGAFQFNDIDSLLGRVGVRIGTSFQASSNLVLQPFVSVSAWHEFSEPTTSSFFCAVACGGALPIVLSTSRVGTFGQFSLGVAAQVLDTGLLSYLRVDYRKGENVEGTSLSGGLRWNF
ncbi:MAG TPA: autotransporter outer membrane beta-barrel domain-containing protein [Sphingomicrobium sp.]|nr:autotransporter outer membrane beta-barrel domain-containing protein [Sphingomicrobium sp.]